MMINLFQSGTWDLEILTALENSSGLCIANFSLEGELLFANAGMKKLFKEKPKDSLISPEFSVFANAKESLEPVYSGLLTIGSNFSVPNITIDAKVFRKSNQILIIGEIDIDELLKVNQHLFELNTEINVLQRNLIKEKTQLNRTLDELRKSKEIIIESESKIRTILTEKEIILKEVHHRIKNNMHIMMGLLFLQANSLKDPGAISALNDASGRMHSMEVLYDKLYRAENIQELSILEYLPSLIEEIIGNFSISIPIQVQKDIDNIILNASKLQPLGILINELLTNVLKYAFLGKEKGNIQITAKLENEMVILVIQDDGNGISESVNFETSSGFGLKLVKMLTKQLNGNIQIERGFGTKFTLHFSK